MSDALQTRMTPAEFLAWEERQELRWEFDGVRPVAMNGGTVEHALVQGNLTTSLTTSLRGRPCRVLGPSMKVSTQEGRYRYPDAFITCTAVSRGATVVAEPVVIFEVLSEGTARTDRTTKLIEYRSIPTLRRYVMLEQDQALITVISRTDDTWSIEVFRAGDTLALPEAGIEVPVAEFYIDVELAPAE